MSKWGKWAFPALFIAAVFAVAALLFAYTGASAQRIYLTPMFNDDKGWDIYTQNGDVRTELTPREIQERDGQTVYLSRVMDKAYEDAGVTYLELDSMRPVAVFLDGQLLYTNVLHRSMKIGRIQFPSGFTGLSARGESVRVSLPSGYAGKTLTIATLAMKNAGTPGVVLASRAISDGETAAVVSRAAMPAASFGMIALLVLGVFLYGGFRRQWDFSLLLLLLSALGQCLHYLAEYESATSASYPLSVPASIFFQPLFIYLPTLFLWFQMRKWRRLCAPLLFAPMIVSLVPAVCTVLGADLGSWYFVLSNLVYVVFAVLVVFSVLEAWRGNTVFRLVLFGLGIAAGITVCIYAASLAGEGVVAENIRTTFENADSGFHSVLVNWMGTILFALCIGVSLTQAVSRTAQAEAELRTLSVKNALAQENLRVLQQSNEAVAAARHNMLHHLTAMQGLAQEGDLVRLSEYIARLNDEAAAILPVRITPHPVVNSILLAVQGRARQAGVDLNCHVDLPETLPIPDNDLCNFLMNLLDNALNAASAVPEGGRRWVCFTMHIRGRYLFIETENSFAGTAVVDGESGLVLSGKGEGHGYGMKTMRQIARRYHSELQVEAAGGVFLVRTALLMSE